MYNGLTAEGIHRKKKLKKNQHILDHMGATELAANLFRSTQAEEKLRRDNVQGKDSANDVHYQSGVVVRRAIAELGGTMPEDLPTVESIKKLERAEKKRLTAPKSERKKPDKPTGKPFGSAQPSTTRGVPTPFEQSSCLRIAKPRRD